MSECHFITCTRHSTAVRDFNINTGFITNRNDTQSVSWMCCRNTARCCQALKVRMVPSDSCVEQLVFSCFYNRTNWCRSFSLAYQSLSACSCSKGLSSHWVTVVLSALIHLSSELYTTAGWLSSHLGLVQKVTSHWICLQDFKLSSETVQDHPSPGFLPSSSNL